MGFVRVQKLTPNRARDGLIGSSITNNIFKVHPKLKKARKANLVFVHCFVLGQKVQSWSVQCRRDCKQFFVYGRFLPLCPPPSCTTVSSSSVAQPQSAFFLKRVLTLFFDFLSSSNRPGLGGTPTFVWPGLFICFNISSSNFLKTSSLAKSSLVFDLIWAGELFLVCCFLSFSTKCVWCVSSTSAKGTVVLFS